MARKKKDGKKKDGKAFVVVRLGWVERYEDRCFTRVEVEEDERRVLGRPIAVFNDRKSAEARVAELERQEREALSPFLFLGPDEYHLEDVTSLKLSELLARLKKLAPKVRPPKADKYEERDWVSWWEENADNLTEEQRQGAWDLLDKLRFYGVMPTEVEE